MIPEHILNLIDIDMGETAKDALERLEQERDDMFEVLEYKDDRVQAILRDIKILREWLA